MIDVLILTSGDEHWNTQMYQVPGIDEKMIIRGKLYKVANITWIIDPPIGNILCNLFVLEI